jgi:hypothetical protein
MTTWFPSAKLTTTTPSAPCVAALTTGTSTAARGSLVRAKTQWRTPHLLRCWRPRRCHSWTGSHSWKGATGTQCRVPSVVGRTPSIPNWSAPCTRCALDAVAMGLMGTCAAMSVTQSLAMTMGGTTTSMTTTQTTICIGVTVLTRSSQVNLTSEGGIVLR